MPVVRLTWINPGVYDSVRIYRDGRQIAETSGDSSAYVDDSSAAGSATYSVRGVIADAASLPDQATCTTQIGTSLIWRGETITALGQAFAAVDLDNALMISNLGATGTDGIEATGPQPVDQKHFDWTPISPSAPDGSFVRLHATGFRGGVGGRDLGTLTVTDIGTQYEISADLSPTGSPSQQLVIYDRGALVARIFPHTGPAARVSQWPSSGEIGHFDVAVDATFYWSSPVAIQIVGGPLLSGDQLRIIGLNPTSPFNSVESMELTTTVGSTFTLLDLVSRPLRSPGDMNCDGLIDFNDIDGFVAALASREGYYAQYRRCNYDNADTNGDGSVDFNDINRFIECLVAGACK